MVPAGNNGAVSIFVTDRTEVILDVSGYFAPSTFVVSHRAAQKCASHQKKVTLFEQGLAMKIRILKKKDGGGVLRVIREDGSETWQKQTERHAAFFALHDLTHLAVETELGYQRAFFGLLAEGWSMDDTTGKGSRGPLPAGAGEVEYLVGCFDCERASMTRWTADEFNEVSSLQASTYGVPIRKLTEEELTRVRSRRSALFRQWAEVAEGSTLDLEFAPAMASNRLLAGKKKN